MMADLKYRDDGTGCRRCGEFHPDCSPCHQSPEDAALDRKQVLDAYAENMREAQEEHRGSRALDVDFQQAAAAGFEPLTLEQKAEYERKLRGASAAIHGGRR